MAPSKVSVTVADRESTSHTLASFSNNCCSSGFLKMSFFLSFENPPFTSPSFLREKEETLQAGTGDNTKCKFFQACVSL